jgi:hypothetical protein
MGQGFFARVWTRAHVLGTKVVRCSCFCEYRRNRLVLVLMSLPKWRKMGLIRVQIDRLILTMPVFDEGGFVVRL